MVHLDALFSAAHEAGARFVTPGALRLYAAVRDRFLPVLGEHFPELVPRYQRAYARRRARRRSMRARCRAAIEEAQTQTRIQESQRDDRPLPAGQDARQGELSCGQSALVVPSSSATAEQPL